MILYKDLFLMMSSPEKLIGVCWVGLVWRITFRLPYSLPPPLKTSQLDFGMNGW